MLIGVTSVNAGARPPPPTPCLIVADPLVQHLLNRLSPLPAAGEAALVGHLSRSLRFRVPDNINKRDK